MNIMNHPNILARLRSTVPAVAAGAMLFAGAASADAQQIITSGHWDLELEYHDGEWEPHWHQHGTGLELELDDVIMRGIFSGDGTFDSPVPRPAGSAWDFTGASAGDPLYILPASNPGGELPYLGIAADEVDFGVFQGDLITMTFKGIQSGPAEGHFSLYAGTVSPVAFFSSYDAGLTQNNNMLSVPVGSHNHLNWTFTELGLYALVFEASGTLLDGTPTSSGDFVAYISIVPEPAAISLLGLAGLALLRRRD